MIKTLKWVYKLGNDHAMNRVYKEIEKARMFHYDQAHIKSLTGQHEENLDQDIRQEFKVSSKQHDQRAKALDEILTTLDPKKYPDISNFMDMLS